MTHLTLVTHKVKLILKAYNYYQKTKDSKKKPVKNFKVFLKKKKKKCKKRPETDIKILLKKKKSVSIIVNLIIFLRNKSKT